MKKYYIGLMIGLTVLAIFVAVPMLAFTGFPQ
jgi:hypothetical protein